MTLEHYPAMTEKQLADIEAEACQRWDLTASLIVHRYGRLEPGDRIVLVVTAAAAPPRRARRLRLPHRLAQDQGAVLEARGDRRRRALGRGTCRGRPRRRALAQRVIIWLPNLQTTKRLLVTVSTPSSHVGC